MAGAATIAASMIRKAMLSAESTRSRTEVAAGSTTRSTLRAPPEQAGRPDEKHDRHDDEDHRVRSFGKEHLGQALDDAEREAGDDRAHDRAHPADHHDGEHDDDEIGAHQRADVVDR